MSSFHFQIMTKTKSHFEPLPSMSPFWPVLRRMTQLCNTHDNAHTRTHLSPNPTAPSPHTHIHIYTLAHEEFKRSICSKLACDRQHLFGDNSALNRFNQTPKSELSVMRGLSSSFWCFTSTSSFWCFTSTSSFWCFNYVHFFFLML